MKNILVPLDGSELAESAVRPALALAARHDATVHLAYVVSDVPPVPFAFPDKDALGPWLKEEERQAGEYLDGIEERLASSAGGQVAAQVRLGPIVPTLLELSDELNADLIVLTTHGRGAWERVWLGSVADEMIRHATRPLLILRADGEASEPFSDESYPARVLVPLDGSPEAESVLTPLQEVLPAAGSRLILTSVLHPVPFASSYLPDTVSEDEVWKEHEARITEYLEALANRLRESEGSQMDVRIMVSRHTAQSLLELAADERVEMIAVSTHGRGGAGRLLFGSIADKLIRGGTVPVLAAHRPEAKNE